MEKIINISYDWDRDKPKISYTKQYKAYNRLEQLDSLHYVIQELNKKYDSMCVSSGVDPFVSSFGKRINNAKN